MPFRLRALHLGGNLGRNAARDPGKVPARCRGGGRSGLRGSACLRIGVDDGGQRARRGFLVVDLRGNGVDGVDLHGHGQFVQVAVVENAAARRDLKGALLLLLRRAPRIPCGERSAARRGASQWRQAQKRKKPQTSQKRASFMGVARGVTVRGRLARRAACIVDQRFEFQIRALRRDTSRRIARCARRGISG